jgi:DTW domain-containing protein
MVRSDAHRCEACRLHRNVCICDRLVSLPTRTRLVLLLHQLEVHKPTNTGRLALRCLPNSELALRGRIDVLAGAADGGRLGLEAAQVIDPGQRAEWLVRAARPVLLFPDPDAVPLTELRDGPPVTLVVPDGTWSQAVRARRRVAGLASIPCAMLPAGLVSTYRLRHEPRAGRLSTLEAIAHALGILEGPEVAESLLAIHRLAIERALWTNGSLHHSQVWGGIPGKPVPEGAVDDAAAGVRDVHAPARGGSGR